ncbi:MAG: AAA family ATPase, partial [Bdellovibrionales bacterium]|nr:AAA family ATPase [Bdellovibrionales bacterium]
MKRKVLLPWVSQIKTHLLQKTGLIQVILGPRQVGKTTSILEFLNKEYPDSHLYVAADRVFHSNPAWVRENWLEARRTRKLLVIDEIQKVANWAESIKALYDEDRRSQGKGVRCILLGSSSLEIQKGLTESLTGRFQLVRAHHWNYRESHEG